MIRKKLPRRERVTIHVLLEKMGEILETNFSIDDEFCTDSNWPDENRSYIMGPDRWEHIDPKYHYADIEDLIDVLNRIRYGKRRFRYVIHPGKNVTWDRVSQEKIYNFHGAK